MWLELLIVRSNRLPACRQKRDFDEARVLVRVDGSKTQTPTGFICISIECDSTWRRRTSVGARLKATHQRKSVSFGNWTFECCRENRDVCPTQRISQTFFLQNKLSVADRSCAATMACTRFSKRQTFVLPNSGVFGFANAAGTANRPVVRTGEFVDFERARTATLSMDPFLSDSGWLLVVVR